jgi:hypothetical protein
MKLLTRFEVILIILAVFVIGLTISIYKNNQNIEGFSYPLTEARIAAGERSKSRYNAFADTQELMSSVVPNGPTGDKILNMALGSPSYEGNSSAKALASLTNLNELPYRTSPEENELLRRVKMCELITSWDCEKLSDPEFARYCGICTSDGEDHTGAKHMGGLYIDPKMRDDERAKANRERRDPKFEPTIGKCKGKFMLDRPKCDIDKDRYECSKAVDFNNQDAINKCGLCVANNTMVYIGNRGNESTNYGLVAKPVKFKTMLRFAVSDPTNADVKVGRMESGSVFKQIQGGSYIPNTNVYIITVEGQENEEISIRIRYPEYKPYNWSDADKNRVELLVNPKRAPLVRAMYGPNLNDYMNDDPRAKDVTEYLKSKFNMKDCKSTNVSITNDGMGGDPTGGIYKQLRLVYGSNGTDFAYSYGTEGNVSQPVMSDNFNDLCPTGLATTDAKKQVCETDESGKALEGRVYTQGNNNGYSGGGDSECLQKLADMKRGIVGVWESMGRVSRTVPIDISVTEVNGFKVSSLGPEKLGTVMGSKHIKVPSYNLPGIPKYLFWFWAKNHSLSYVDFKVVIPATMRDPTIDQDISLCPIGPIVSTPEGVTRLNAGACEQAINGQQQGPGNFTDACIQKLYLSSGCTVKGQAYPSNSQKKAKLTTNQLTGDNLEIDDIFNNLQDLYQVATTGTNSNNDNLEEGTVTKMALDCLGEIKLNPCDSANAATGPHTPQCLDYLFRSAGANNTKIGATYQGMANRSSGTNAKLTKPIMYCQRAGSMSPISSKGQLNNEAIAAANAKGGIQAVKEFYRQIHYDANFNSKVAPQKLALQQCYGIGVTPKAPVCPIMACSNILLPKNVSLRKGNKIGTVIHNGDFELSFKINVKGIVATNWGSILHFTKSGRDCCGFGDRAPGIWFYPNTLKLYVILGDADGGGDWGLRDLEMTLPNNKESSFMLKCSGSSIVVNINGTAFNATQPSSRPKGSFDVWAADPWYEAANADLKDLCFMPK